MLCESKTLAAYNIIPCQLKSDREKFSAAGVSMSEIASPSIGVGDGPSKNARKEEKMKKKEEERLKKEEEKRRKEEAKAAGGAVQPKKTQEADDEDMDPTQYFENRLKVLAAQKEAGHNPYPHKFHVDMTVPQYVKKYGNLKDGEHLENETVSLAGQIMNKRYSSSKLFFYDLHGLSAKVQLMADARTSDLDEAEFSKFHAGVKRGGIVGVIGYPG